MDKFEQGHYSIWGLPMKERIIKIQEIHFNFGIKLTWNEAKKFYNEIYDCETWLNDIYQVDVHRKEKADWLVHDEKWKGKITYLSIKRRDKKPIHDWRQLQQIKNELVGDEFEAIELYPKESRVVDQANQFHIFVLPKNEWLPLGFMNRNVDYTKRLGGFNKTGQRAINE